MVAWCGRPHIATSERHAGAGCDMAEVAVAQDVTWWRKSYAKNLVAWATWLLTAYQGPAYRPMF